MTAGICGFPLLLLNIRNTVYTRGIVGIPGCGKKKSLIILANVSIGGLEIGVFVCAYAML